jgi:imidazolonepropionase-like amidohydrolase
MTQPASNDTFLADARIIDGTGREPYDRGAVRITDGRIVAIGQMDSVDSGGADVVDLEGRTIMPGMIDSHTHLTYPADQLRLSTLETETSLELNAIKAGRNAHLILQMGVTTIGDGGCRGYIGPAVRDAIASGVIPGPRVVSCGPILCGTGGLGDRLPLWMEFESDHALGMLVDGPDEVRRAVRLQVKGGVDWIKLSASGVAGSKYIDAETEDLTYEEIEAAVAEARKFGRPVHAHAHSREAVKSCAQLGVLSLHSGEFADEEGLEMMREHGTIFSPTIAWLHARLLPEYPLSADAEFYAEARKAFESAIHAVRAAHELGVKLALGTDASHRFPHVPDAALELEYLVALGYTPLEAVACATGIAAEAIGRADELGTLEAGKSADVLVLDSDPSEDIRVLRDKRTIVRMFKQGHDVQLDPARGFAGADFDPTPDLRSVVGV